MGSLIEGNIDKALGFGVMEIGGLKINLSLTTAKDLITYQQLPAKYLKSKEPTIEESMALQEGYREYFVNYLKSKDLETPEEKINLFVTKYLNKFIEEFPIATGMRTREESEKLKQEIEVKQKN